MNKDISPISVRDIEYRGTKLQAKSDIFLTLELDDSKQLVCAEKYEIGLSVYAETREELIKEINRQLVVLWNGYALCSDDKLSLDAIELKTSLKSFFKERE